MRAVIQRVKKCIVTQEGSPVSSIGPGYVMLVCFRSGVAENLDKVVKKVLEMRMFDSWNKSLCDMGFELMVLSQFTLYAQLKGRKPSFHHAEERGAAKELFAELISRFRECYCSSNVKSGVFGACLEIETALDGPCTVVLDL